MQSPVVFYQIVDSGPDERQAAVGQAWIACSLASPYGGNPLTGSLKGGHGSGALPADFAACFEGSDLSRSISLPCDQPHQAQLFAHMWLDGPGPDLAELTASCRQFIADATRIADPDKAAGLHANAFAYFTDATASAFSPTEATLPLQPGRTAYASCAINTDDGRFLNDSLIALGDRPIPWVP